MKEAHFRECGTLGRTLNVTPRIIEASGARKGEGSMGRTVYAAAMSHVPYLDYYELGGSLHLIISIPHLGGR